MSYKKSDLAAAKRKLREEDPSFFKNKASKTTKNKAIKKIIKSSYEAKKKVIKWSYEINDLVRCIHTDDIGLIVSNNQYFGKKLEKNYFFVLFGCTVKAYDGKYIRKL